MISFYYYCYYSILLLLILVQPCYGEDTLFQGQQLLDGKSLSSPKGVFSLYFDSLGDTDKRFLVIRNVSHYRQAVWVSNRNHPIPDDSGRLAIDPKDGLLKIFYSGGVLPLPNHAPIGGGTNTSVALLDTGNLVLRGLNGSILWQSFDYPVDTFLPGMKIGMNFRTGRNWTLNAWLGEMLPATGVFTLSMDPSAGKEQLTMLWRRRTFWSSGLLRNGKFESLFPSICNNFNFTSNGDEKYFMYSSDCPDIEEAGLTLSYNGRIVEQGKEVDYCTEPEAEGCVRQELPECRVRQGEFWVGKYINIVIEGTNYVFGDLGLNLFDCQAKCLANCSCVAFGSMSKNGTGCEIWSEMTLKEVNGLSNRTLYAFHPGKAPKKKSQAWLIIVIVIGSIMLLLGLLLCLVKRRKLFRNDINEEGRAMHEKVMEGTYTSSKRFIVEMEEEGIRMFSLESLIIGTNDFSNVNKLGEGGFGSVYKGNLPNGQEVAIKRLSKKSRQGMIEFKNEVLLIAKLQHTNLVKLLGSCIEGEEMILVYEYMANKSLDNFLFDPSRQGQLKWPIRVRIIQGIAQGLLYLHKYSRLKVIHRDLKASNILLDRNMNPKISDFGMARIFEVQGSRENTNKIVGTHGYMAPEYVINGVVSLKTDIYSFGVLLLEIISGKKNRRCYDTDRPLNLVGLAWELWTKGRAMEFKDSTMDDHAYSESEHLKFINVGLLCVQENPIERPSMADIVSMLINETVHIPTPKQPAYFIKAVVGETNISGTSCKSPNDISLSVMDGR